MSKTYLFRMTHIENIPHILKFGITHSSSINASPNFVPIGDNTIISTRNDFLLNNGKNLGAYIPFYFGVRNPMLYVIQNGYNMVAPTPVENIVYCVTSIKKIIDLQLDFVFTNGHAVDGFTSQYSPSDIPNIDTILDWKAINEKYWINDQDLDLKRRKEAEFLVMGDIEPSGVLGFVVYNQNAQTRMANFGINTLNVPIKSHFYF